jgi:hypothetical protein
MLLRLGVVGAATRILMEVEEGEVEASSVMASRSIVLKGVAPATSKEPNSMVTLGILIKGITMVDMAVVMAMAAIKGIANPITTGTWVAVVVTTEVGDRTSLSSALSLQERVRRR